MKKVLALVLAIAMVAVMFVACTKKEEEKPAESSKTEPAKPDKSEPAKSESKGGKKYDAWNIAAVYSEITGDFFSIVYNGCTAALDELKAEYGITGYCIAPANGSDATQQMDLLDTVLLEKSDGLILCPVNADTIGTYVTDNFKDDSIPIIVIDRSLNTTSPAFQGYYYSDAYQMSVGQYEMAKEATEGKEGPFYYVSIGISKDNQQWANRSYGFIDMAKNDDKFISYLDEPYWTSQVTQEQTIQFIQDTINSNPDKQMILLAVCDSHNNYCISAVSELSQDKKDRTIILGWDFNETSLGYLKNGDAYGFMGQNPYLMGYDSVYMMCDYLSGDKDAVKDKSVPSQAVSQKNLDSEEVKAYMRTLGMNV